MNILKCGKITSWQSLLTRTTAISLMTYSHTHNWDPKCYGSLRKFYFWNYKSPRFWHFEPHWPAVSCIKNCLLVKIALAKSDLNFEDLHLYLRMFIALYAHILQDLIGQNIQTLVKYTYVCVCLYICNLGVLNKLFIFRHMLSYL